MNSIQRTALQNPCTLAEQCNDPRYFSSVEYGGLRFGVGLTVNTGDE